MGSFGSLAELNSYYLMAFVLFRGTASPRFDFFVFHFEKTTEFWAFLGSAVFGHLVSFVLNRFWKAEENAKMEQTVTPYGYKKPLAPFPLFFVIRAIVTEKQKKRQAF